MPCHSQIRVCPDEAGYEVPVSMKCLGPHTLVISGFGLAESTVLYCTVPHRTTLYSTVQHSTVLYSTGFGLAESPMPSPGRAGWGWTWRQASLPACDPERSRERAAEGRSTQAKLTACQLRQSPSPTQNLSPTPAKSLGHSDELPRPLRRIPMATKTKFFLPFEKLLVAETSPAASSGREFSRASCWLGGGSQAR